ncbi:bifunctional 5,10-methylenetetrahydrofolate dehydrogenase/5,10-methenyltetrahydrofolate cyclohydrolase [Romboutsia ilealis]|uniref:Bifunctional 5,10-methylenetetrahydrofolate dehydrogenase/5,10-methenyltetrahydrofolate cyclohydrolase n=1 Tax=Romboutsia faecis TaxID=2764597 RepID=A0ABR7JR31_9FIRM|nr:bifunctional 5,10-methylenetetrahydrofolate dehydrogenase/5,10-methenyltetrahydrofolate cyclohydrolase [Romboutsia faecis]MBC5997368.1 bifunctional 5,10-methylenetetrahydrofolate dehydrogenase/5,10-methenyltetrahydrofolate cyclohydrolase [Romboutsia faecis]MRN23650.1 bifunctional 5,10-methylenetetrahydrofolate dehydrogenase/5,10-methenyltetrahydrofolate cyclohydrolase [Romboutsia ilealis]
MTKIVDAIEMCENKIHKFKEETKTIEARINRKPEFIIINASDDEGNARYIKGKITEGEKAGLNVNAIKLEADCTNNDVEEIINRCNEEKIPVILQLPTYKHLDTEYLMKLIDYTVDADGFAKEWIGEINLGNDKLLAPATPKGVISLLEYNNIEIEGKIALVIGKSNHVGKPLCSMLMNRGATLINANSKTKNLSELVKMADIVISCVGRQNLVDAKDIKDGATVIGVGFTYVGRKQILDFDVDEIVNLGKASVVSNRINCTGKATINSLIENVIELYKMNFEIMD